MSNYDSTARLAWIQKCFALAGTAAVHPDELDSLHKLLAGYSGWISTVAFLRILIIYSRRRSKPLRTVAGEVNSRALLMRAKALAALKENPGNAVGNVIDCGGEWALAPGVAIGRIDYNPNNTSSAPVWLLVKAEKASIKTAYLKASDAILIVSLSKGRRIDMTVPIIKEAIRTGLLINVVQL